MTLTEAPVEFGVQEPRFLHTPSASVDNAAVDAIDLCAAIGMPLDPWQQVALSAMLGVASDGSWTAQEFGLIAARQNGKSAILEARELAGLFLFGERRIIHSAHNANTAKEAFDRMAALIRRTPMLWAETEKILGSPGNQAVILKSGAKLSYSTRTKGGARGFSAPVVIFDEAQELTGEQYAAIVPVTSSFKNRQLIYTGTVLAGATVFQGLVARGRQRIGTDFGYAEWSAPEECASDDPYAIRQANPAIGYRPGLTVEYFLNDFIRWEKAGEERRYREERLSIWPDETTVGQIISASGWAKGVTDWRPDAGQLVERIGVASSVDGAWSSVGVAFRRGDHVYVEVVKHEAGTAWVIPYVQGLVERRRASKVYADQGGPASRSLGNGLATVLPYGVYEELKTEVTQRAVATFVDSVAQGRVEHKGDPLLDAAALGVKEKFVGDHRMYDRRKSPVVIAPVEAVTLAAWGLLPDPKAKTFSIVNLNDYTE